MAERGDYTPFFARSFGYQVMYLTALVFCVSLALAVVYFVIGLILSILLLVLGIGLF